MIFRDRRDAGRKLALKLMIYAHQPQVVVLALPRGGVPVGFEVAQALHAPLEVFVVRKLGVPGHDELAMGALATGGVLLLDRDTIQKLRISEFEISKVIAREQQELERRNRLYRGNRPLLVIRDQIVILVDDGLATGATMHSACVALRRLLPARLVVGVPIAAPQTCTELQPVADEIVCAVTPEPFYAISAWYEDFSQTTDAGVRELLAQAAAPTPLPSP